ncbi:MAG: LasR-specific antiactivator QslA [Pseudomonas sp.]
MSRRFVSYLPGYDEQSPALITWSEDCQAAFTQGAESAQAWLASAHTGWLWASLIVERECLPPGNQRRAFEVGFLSRVHQRLCSPLGGQHEARQTRFWL